MDRHADKIFSITEASLSTYDKPELPIHNAALNCVTMFDWNVSDRSFSDEELIAATLERYNVQFLREQQSISVIFSTNSMCIKQNRCLLKFLAYRRKNCYKLVRVIT